MKEFTLFDKWIENYNIIYTENLHEEIEYEEINNVLDFNYSMNQNFSLNEKLNIIKNIIENLNNKYYDKYIEENLIINLWEKWSTGEYTQIESKNNFIEILNEDIKNFSFNSSSIEKHFDFSNKETFFNLRILPGNIGYLQYSHLPILTEEVKNEIDSCLFLLKNTESLVLDLRDTDSFDFNYASYLLSRFTNEEISYLIDENQEEILLMFPENQIYYSPILVLINENSAKGAELIAFELQKLDKAIIIGSKSKGDNKVYRKIKLDEDFQINIPYASALHPSDGTSWNTGIIPDIITDTALEEGYAQSLNLLSIKHDGVEKNKYLKLLNELKD